MLKLMKYFMSKVVDEGFFSVKKVVKKAKK